MLTAKLVVKQAACLHYKDTKIILLYQHFTYLFLRCKL